MKKYLIFYGYGTDIPDAVAKIIKECKDKGLNTRTGEIIDRIETEAVTETINTQEDLLRLCTENPDKIFNLYDSGVYAGLCGQTGRFSTATIVPIDETKKWIIDEYDGSESIRELPEYELADAELNIYRERRKN